MSSRTERDAYHEARYDGPSKRDFAEERGYEEGDHGPSAGGEPKGFLMDALEKSLAEHRAYSQARANGNLSSHQFGGTQ